MSLLLFLLIYCAIYGGMNFLVFWKLRLAFPEMGRWALLPALFLALMVAGPILVQTAARGSLLRPARMLAWVAYPWIALVFWLMLLLLVADLWNLAARGGAWHLPPRPAFLAAAALTAVLGLWSLHEAQSLRLERVILRTPRLAPGAQPLRITQISDLHLGILSGPESVARVVALVEQTRPDLIVCTGDLAEAGLEGVENLAAPLSVMRAPLGKFAIFGNHEKYAGAALATRFIGLAGFRLLRNETVALEGAPVRLVGVDDPDGRAPTERAAPSVRESDLLPERGAPGLTLLLKHRPTVETTSLGRFFLQLSGHTHGGQIFPFGQLVVRRFFPYLSGLHQLSEDSFIYVSRGTGCWGPPMRLLSPPEVTLIIIEPE